MPLRRLSKTWRTNVVGWAATIMEKVEVLKAQKRKVLWLSSLS